MSRAVFAIDDPFKANTDGIEFIGLSDARKQELRVKIQEKLLDQNIRDAGEDKADIDD